MLTPTNSCRNIARNIASQGNKSSPLSLRLVHAYYCVFPLVLRLFLCVYGCSLCLRWFFRRTCLLNTRNPLFSGTCAQFKSGSVAVCCSAHEENLMSLCMLHGLCSRVRQSQAQFSRACITVCRIESSGTVSFSSFKPQIRN